MFITPKEVVDLNEENLKTIVEKKIPEGLYFDYKSNLSRKSEKEAKREFLKDVTAFANSHGGNILIGVKEPTPNLTVNQQIVGIDNGDKIAQNLERVTSTSIDPRISGLRIVPVPLSNGKYCILVHIPPSLSRPHMVQHQGHFTFYMRHTESSFIMTTHQIRESVLSSFSAEAKAKQYMEEKERDVRLYEIKEHPLILLQAIPLISLEKRWDVLDSKLESVLRGYDRQKKYRNFVNLASSIAPKLFIDGLMGRDSREELRWKTEIHRNGYVSTIYHIKPQKDLNNVNRYILDSAICELLEACGDLINEAWSITNTDLPYLISCKYLNAKGTVLYTEAGGGDFSEPFERNELVWPLHFRNVSQDVLEIIEEMCTEMYNAFGEPQAIK